MPPYEILYISELSPTTSPATIAEILVQARKQNKLNGITGLLLFDGEHFIQVLEGDREEVLAVMSRIESDARHSGVKRLHEGFIAQRQFQCFGIGYWYVEDESRVLHLGKLSGRAAMDELLARRGEFDVESDTPLFSVPAPKPVESPTRSDAMAFRQKLYRVTATAPFPRTSRNFTNQW